MLLSSRGNTQLAGFVNLVLTFAENVLVRSRTRSMVIDEFSRIRINKSRCRCCMQVKMQATCVVDVEI